jgi:hypothetical protein
MNEREAAVKGQDRNRHSVRVYEQAVDLRSIIANVAYHRCDGRKKVNNKGGTLNEQTAALVDW